MVKIRLARVGTKKTPIYRVVVTDSRSPRDGKHIELIGLYDPRAKDASKTLVLDRDRLSHWQKIGAQLSEEVTNLVKRNPRRRRRLLIDGPLAPSWSTPS